MFVDPGSAMLISSALGGLFGGGQQQPQMSPVDKKQLGWWKHWRKVASGSATQGGPLGDVWNYWLNQMQNPFGEQFQTQWKQYQDESGRRYGTLTNNMAYQLAQRMGGTDNSAMPGLMGYLTRMQGQDENDWLRNYATTAQATAGQNLMGILQQMMGGGGNWTGQMVQPQQGNNLSGLMQMLGYMYGQSQNK